MQVVGHVANVKPRQRELLQRKIEQPAIVRLEVNFAVRFENSLVQLQKAHMRQAAFGVTFFRPRVAKIYVKPVDFVLGEKFSDICHVKDNQTDVAQIFFANLTRRRQYASRFDLKPDKIYLRVALGDLRNEVAFARA